MKRNSVKRSVNTNGAARKRQRRVTAQRNRARQFLRFIVAGTAVGAVVATGLLGYQWFDRASMRAVTELSLSGNFNWLSREEVAAMVSPEIESGELIVPLQVLRQTLESNTWVDQASVNWRWPGRLNISIVEQIPIARWGNAGFVNSRGEVVGLADQSTLEALPLLSGQPGQEKVVMQNYQKLNQLLRAEQLRIKELTSDELMNWKIVLSSGTTIVVGRDQVMEKVQRFLLVYQRGLHRRFDKVKQVDLRYGSGVAVGWKSGENNGVEDQDLQLARLGERRGG